jgi:hypothetical protein
VYRNYVAEFQQTLMEDDCWLPGLTRKVSALAAGARLSASKGNAEVLRNGIDRPVDGADNGLSLAPGQYAGYTLDKPAYVSRARFVFDSDLNRDTQNEGSLYRRPMYATYYLNAGATHVPKTMTKAFRLTLTLADGTSRTIDVADNHRRLVYVDIGAEVSAVRFEPLSTWGSPEAHVFSFEIE